MKHKHVTTCEHEIKVCDCCDTAYCAKCDKEWGAEKPCNLQHFPTYVPYYPQPVLPARPYWWYTTPYVSVGGNAWGTITNAGGGYTNTNTNMKQLSSTGANIQ